MFAAVSDLGAEPILSEEWVRELATNIFCRAANGETGIRTARFTVSVDSALVPIAPLEGSSQIHVRRRSDVAFSK